MKKITSILLVVLMLFSLVSLAGCGKSALKLGVATYAYTESALNSLEGDDGFAKVSINVAAVLLDKKGKIVDCAIEAVEYEPKFTANGEYLPTDVIVGKYEKGENYGMDTYGGSKKDWYAQVDAFEELIKGKTVEEVKALVAKDRKGNKDVINAGCTIVIEEFVIAIEMAAKNATETNVKEGNTLKIGTVSTQTGCKNADEVEDGVNHVDTSISVLALNKDKIVYAQSDALQVEIKFNTKGEDLTKHGKITTKRTSGDKYGMSKYGQDLNGDGEVKEWYLQADAFDAALIGKDAAGVAKLVTDNGYGNKDLQTAGCTIAISDMVKAAEKAAKIK
jgi:hypothetical protein